MLLEKNARRGVNNGNNTGMMKCFSKLLLCNIMLLLQSSVSSAVVAGGASVVSPRRLSAIDTGVCGEDSFSSCSSLDIVNRFRGGSDDEYDDYEEEEEDEMGGIGGTAAAVALDVAKQAAWGVGKVSVLTYKRFKYAVMATFEADDEDISDDQDSSLSTIVLNKVSRFLKALLQGPESVAIVTSSVDSKKETSKKISSKSNASESFVSCLKSNYGVNVYDASTVIDGSLSDALKDCRSQAKLLVAFIPANSQSKKKDCSDVIAAKSLYSEEVDVIANYKGGSFGLWGCLGGSREATSSLKRIRASIRKSIPVLAVVYPAQVRSFFIKIIISLTVRKCC